MAASHGVARATAELSVDGQRVASGLRVALGQRYLGPPAVGEVSDGDAVCCGRAGDSVEELGDVLVTARLRWRVDRGDALSRVGIARGGPAELEDRRTSATTSFCFA